MKNALKASVVLLVLAISICIFQISCQKEAKAQSNDSLGGQQNKIIFSKGYDSEIRVANYDGSGQKKLDIIRPLGSEINEIPNI